MDAVSYTYEVLAQIKLMYGSRAELPYGVTLDSLGYDDPLDVAELTEDELISLRFGRWSDENHLYLIPGWLFPLLPEDVTLTTINGDVVHGKSNIDTDIRFGMLAYGVVPTVLSEADRVDRDDWATLRSM